MKPWNKSWMGIAPPRSKLERHLSLFPLPRFWSSRPQKNTTTVCNTYHHRVNFNYSFWKTCLQAMCHVTGDRLLRNYFGQHMIGSSAVSASWNLTWSFAMPLTRRPYSALEFTTSVSCAWRSLATSLSSRIGLGAVACLAVRSLVVLKQNW